MLYTIFVLAEKLTLFIHIKYKPLRDLNQMFNNICLLGRLGVNLLVNTPPSDQVEDVVDSNLEVTCLAAWFMKMVIKSLISNTPSFISLNSFG